MFTKQNETESKLDAEISDALDKLKTIDKTDEKYGKLVEQISKLHKLKAEESPQKISNETYLIVAANFLGILAIINHEHTHAITSKAIGFIPKLR